MEIITIIVYSPSSNRKRIQLLDGDIPIDLRLVTKMAIKVGKNEIIDSDAYPSVFKWGPSVSISVGVVDLYLGNVVMADRITDAEFVVYDEFHHQGLFFGFIRIRWIEDC